MTDPRSTAARDAVSLHAANPDRSRCRLYDGMDTGPEDRRCWLNPGHQCDCMDQIDAETEAMTDEEVRAELIAAGLDPEPPQAYLDAVQRAVDRHRARAVFHDATGHEFGLVLNAADVTVTPADTMKSGETLHVSGAIVSGAVSMNIAPLKVSHPAGPRAHLPPRQRTGPIPARVTAKPDKKAARKRQKAARRGNRSK